MAGRRGDPRDDSCNGETYPRSADVSQCHHPEKEQGQGQPQSGAPPTSQYLGYADWNAPPLHPGFQEPHYAVPCANDSAPGNGAWQQSFHPVPAMSAAPRDADQGEGTAFGAIPHRWDNQNPTGAAWVYAPPLASDSQPNYVVDRGPTLAANTHSGASTNAQPYAPGVGPDTPIPSQSLEFLARRLVLNLGTHVKALNVEASDSGRLKVTISLETADIV